jgi:hypothetical protein
MRFILIFFQLCVCYVRQAYQQNTITYAGYGTFTNSSPFSDPIYRPTASLPQDPSFISTQFFLYSNQRKMTNGTLITWTTTINEFFATNKKATIIVHGWTQNAFKNWIIAMKDAILGVENTNVITVNWSQGASGSYDQSIANSQIVGIDLARLINTYVLNGILTYDGIHIIGHSLGAHVAGFAGQLTVLKVPRITGLDPAGPYFDGMSPIVRLDKTDATFVDIIHSDAEILYPFQFGAGVSTSSG